MSIQAVARVALLVSIAGASAAACAPATDESTVAASAELGARAADATGMGPYATTSSEYRLPAGIDPDVLAERATELWARVYRPATLTKHPLLVFLHGNHSTCGRGANPRIDDSSQYTSQGTCPSGYVVAPNHLGYGYIAERLASWGYVVVSINANRGINAAGGVSGDFGLNLARGRLILKHLQRLSEWNATPGTTPPSLGVDLSGKLDFGEVGLMGHSRGGEGVRAAHTLFRDPESPWPSRIVAPLRVKAIFEIGPVDGQTDRTLDAFGTNWNVLLPMCDGDVTNLQGMPPFDRMLARNEETNPTPKGMFAVWGANHNFYNTEWQLNDSRGCRGSGHKLLFPSNAYQSALQQATGMHALMGFFRAHVGPDAEPSFNTSFDPQFALPSALESITPIQRAYADAVDGDVVRLLEDFSKAQGTSLGGQPTIVKNVQVTHGGVAEHDRALRAATVRWSTNADASFEIPWTAPGTGIDTTAMTTLDLRLSLPDTVPAGIGFSVQLVNAGGTASAKLPIGGFAKLLSYGGHVVLESTRIPLGAFTGTDRTQVRGVRFVFDDTAKGAIILTSLRLSRAPATSRERIVSGSEPKGPSGSLREPVRFSAGNRVEEIRELASNDVEIALFSPNRFPPLDELAVLRIGDKDLRLSRYAGGDEHRLVFTAAASEATDLRDGAAMTVRYGQGETPFEWTFGTFDRNAIKR